MALSSHFERFVHSIETLDRLFQTALRFKQDRLKRCLSLISDHIMDLYYQSQYCGFSCCLYEQESA